ncbi:OmpA family protein [Reyranella sp.]|uniref:OmpA family protein n=1 Tax=Reyranella sp. TaxID=1929291 RepID=UPI003F710501
MQRPQDTIGSGRWLGLLGVSAFALLTGCGWFDGFAPVGPPPRPGVERDVAPASALPPAPGNRQYDAAVTAGDETRNTTASIGSVISAKGGQKAQKEALEKEQAERDRKDREARLEREAADKELKSKEKQEGAPAAAPAAAPVGAPPVGAGTITSDPAPVSAPVPPPAPVTTAPMAPPSAAPDPATAPTPVPAPSPAGNPNRAFTPPPGWTPPGAEPGSVTTGAPPASPAPPAAAPPPAPPADPNKAFAPQPGWKPSGVAVGSLLPLAPLPVAFAASDFADDACGEPMPAMANIAAAQSGAVPFSSLKSPPFDGSIQVALIQFGQASAGLDETDQAVLARVAEIQRDNGGTVRIVGHAAADAVSIAQSDNFDVSRRRALAVARQLRRLGVPADQLMAEAASDNEPIYQTSTARGLAANRRADVFIDF